MRRDLVRKADLGAQIADDADEQDFQRQADGTRRALGEFFPHSVRSIHDGPCHSSTSLAACLIVITRRSAARVRLSPFYSLVAKLRRAVSICSRRATARWTFEAYVVPDERVKPHLHRLHAFD